MRANQTPSQDDLHRKENAGAVTVATPPPQGSPSSAEVNAWWDNASHWVKNVVKRLLEHVEIEADDVTQSVMLKAHAAIHQFRGESQFKTWLFQITAHTVADYRKGIKPNLTSLDEPTNAGQEDGVGPRFEPAAPRVDFAAYRCADEMLSVLSPRDRDILRAKYEGETSEEIGARLGMKAPAVRKRVNKSLNRLRQLEEQKQTGLARADRKPPLRREDARERRRKGLQQ
jgi:RNA polymerase sigma-70 factor (ECF subfamily)